MIEEWNSLGSSLQMLVKGFIYLFLCWGGALFIRKNLRGSNKIFWHVGIIGILLLSLLSFHPSLWHIAIPADQPTNVVAQGFADDALHQKTNIVNQAANQSNTPQANWNAASVLFAIWLSGASFLFLRWLMGVLKTRRLISCAQSASHQLQNVFSECNKRLGIRRDVRLVLSKHCSTPFLYGFLRPAIVAPLGSEEWDIDTQQTVFLHELEHFRAHDTELLILSNFAKILHWPNPMVWFGVRAWRESTEYAVDQSVIQSGISATAYAEILVRFAAQSSPRQLSLGLTMAHNAHKIEQRVSRLLQKSNIKPIHQRMKIITTTILVTSSLLIGGLSCAQKELKVTLPETNNQKDVNVSVQEKIKLITIPEVEFKHTSLEKAIDFLRTEMRKHDTIAKDPKLKGANLMIKNGKHLGKRKITQLSLKNASPELILQFLCDITRTQYKVDESGIWISELEDDK